MGKTKTNKEKKSSKIINKIGKKMSRKFYHRFLL